MDRFNIDIRLRDPDDPKEEIDRQLSCCFTGHRSSKLPAGGSRSSTRIKALISRIDLMIREMIENEGVRFFLSGMASGADLLCAEAVVRLKNIYPQIELYCISPYLGHVREMKSADELYTYGLVREKAFQCVTLSDSYYKECYRARNDYLVSHCAHMIAVFDPAKTRSGTAMALNIARAQELDIKVITDY